MSKIALSGDASGTGTFTIASPNSNSNFTLTLPAETGTIVTTATTTGISASALTTGTIPKARMYAGAVLQVVQTVKTDTFSHNNGYTFTNVTGASVTITPISATSKILVLYSCSLSQSAASGTYGLFARITRDGTVIVQGDSRGSTTRAVTAMPIGNYNYTAQHSFQYLDSPASTAALTYQLQIAVETGSQIIIGGSWQTGAAPNASTPTTITVMEIAG